MRRLCIAVTLLCLACGGWLVWVLWPQRGVTVPPEAPRSPVMDPARSAAPPGGVRRYRPVDRPEPVVSAPTARVSGDETARPVDAIAGEHIISFGGMAERDAFITAAKALGAVIRDVSDFGNAVCVRLGPGMVLADLRPLLPEDAESSPNYFVLSPEIPRGNPAPPESGYLPFGSHALEWLGVGNNTEWGRGVTIAVLDSGVASHPALPNSAVLRIDLLGEEAVGAGGYGGHGTAVASLAAGRDGMGVAPQADILSIKVLSPSGVGDVFTLARGIVEAVDRGADVINLCLGTSADSPFLRRAIGYALGEGVVVVAAAGNDALEGVSFPARYEGVLGVSAVDANGRHLYFANRGPEVDLAAPGLNVQAASTDDGEAEFSGTSAAVPFVSGAVAAVLSLDPALSGTEAAEILLRTCNDAETPGVDDAVGNGILSLSRAMQRDTPGIYDVGVGAPYVERQPGGGVAVTVYAQNRGTEPLSAVTLDVTVGGQPASARFSGVAVGRTVSRRLGFAAPATAGTTRTVDIICTARIDGRPDANPADNAARMVLFMGAGGSSAK